VLPLIAAVLAATFLVFGNRSHSSNRHSEARTSSLAPVSGPYSPSIDPANFVARIDNPYFPLERGTSLHYEGVAEDGKTRQTDIAVVTGIKKKVMGVTCTAVRDTVSSHGKPVERTFDWYAQDKQGNVWYFGEDARNYRNGRFVKARDSWEGGVDGAKPGIIMEASPRRGDSYRQEYYLGHAEDQARVIGRRGAVRVPFRTFKRTLVTIEKSALEPGAREKKWYTAGVGEIKSKVIKGDHEAFALVGVKR
jgi:hypothetical protein